MNPIIIIIVLLVKEPIYIDHFALSEKFESIHKVPKFKINQRKKIIKYKKIFIRVWK